MLFGGKIKQSGSILPCESPSFPVLPGNIAMHFSRSNTATSSACCTPVLPNLSRTFFCMNSSAFCCPGFRVPLIVNVLSPGV